MAIPLLGSTESISNTALDNFGDGRRLSVPGGCQTRSRRSPAGNQSWTAITRVRYLSRSDRSIRERRDRERRPRTYHQRTRSQSHQQTHLSEVGQLLARGGQTLSRPGMAQKTACGSKNQRPYSEPYVSFIREGHALGIGSVGTQPDGPRRTKGSEQTPTASAHFDGGRVRGFVQAACPTLPLYGALGWMHRSSYQRANGLTLDVDQLR